MSIVRPLVGFVHASAQNWPFYQVPDENRAKFKISYSCGHRVLKSARYDTMLELRNFIEKYLHFSKTSLDEPLDVHLCSYFHEQNCVTRRDVIQT